MGFKIMNRSITVLKIKDKKRNLTNVSEINREVTESIKIKKSFKGVIPEASSRLVHKIQDHPIIKQPLVVNVDNMVYRFVPKVAFLEHRRKNIYESDSQLLPRNQMIATDTVNLAVVEKDDFLYLLVFSAEPRIITRIKMVLSLGDDGLAGEQIDPGMFTWLFYNFSERQGEVDHGVGIEEMYGFTSQIDLNTPEDIVSARANGVQDLSATQVEIALKHPLKSVSLRMKLGAITALFLLNQNQSFRIDDTSTKLGNAFDIRFDGYSKDVDSMAQATYIFLYVIPRISTLFKNGKASLEESIENYRGRITAELINKLEATLL